jgi:hypothetical protein
VLAEAVQLLALAAPARALSPLSARAVIAQDGALWKLHLEIASGEGPGTRDLQDESCARLGQVAALALALAAESAPAPASPTRPAPPPQSTSPRFLVRALIGGDLGTLRAASPGPGLALGVLLGRTRVEAVANYWLPESGGGIEDRLFSGGVHACLALLDAPEVGVCAGVEGGAMKGRGELGSAPAVTSGWLAMLAGAALGWELTHWLAVRAEIGLGMTLAGPTFDAGDGSARGGPAPLFGRFVLGVEARL